MYILIVTASASKHLYSWLFVDPSEPGSEHHYTSVRGTKVQQCIKSTLHNVIYIVFKYTTLMSSKHIYSKVISVCGFFIYTHAGLLHSQYLNRENA